MSIPTTLLVATDFSDSARHALDYAVDLAERLGASVVVMHAYELPLVGFPDGTLTVTAEMASRIIDAASRALDDSVKRYEGRHVKISSVLEQMEPREGILAVAKRINADLLVLGTHGRRGFARVIMGSVAEHLVRSASIPVLTLR